MGLPHGCGLGILRQEMIRLGTVAILLSFLLVIPCSAGKSADQLIDSGVKEFRNAYRKWDGDGFTGAKSRFFEATKLKPKSADAHYWLGVARFHQMLFLNRHADAAKHVNRAKSEREAALASFDRLLELDGGHAEGHALKATILGMKIQDAALGGLRFGRSLQKHQKAAMNAGTKNPRVHYLAGVALFHLAKKPKDHESALNELQNATKLYKEESKKSRPHSAPKWGRDSCHTFTGLVLEKLGRNQEAVSQFRHALALHPQDHTAKEGLKRLVAGQ